MNTFECINIIGLTGQSGAGKTTVSSMFSDFGFAVIDADSIARMVASYQPFLEEVRAHFPKCVTDLGLDRKLMASAVFSDKKKMTLYSSIIYPFITTAVFNAIRTYKEQGIKYILLDAPTLFESGIDDICDAVVSVTAPYEMLKERIMLRDGITENQAKARLSAQHDQEWFVNKSDYNISNGSDHDALKDKVIDVIKQIKERFDA